MTHTSGANMAGYSTDTPWQHQIKYKRNKLHNDTTIQLQIPTRETYHQTQIPCSEWTSLLCFSVHGIETLEKSHIHCWNLYQGQWESRSFELKHKVLTFENAKCYSLSTKFQTSPRQSLRIKCIVALCNSNHCSKEVYIIVHLKWGGEELPHWRLWLVFEFSSPSLMMNLVNTARLLMC